MGRSFKKLLVALLFSIGSMTLASEQALYFHLHQACGFLELFVNKKCPKASEMAKTHLTEADAELGKMISGSHGKASGSAFEPDLQKLWGFYNYRLSLKVVQIEGLRQEIHSKAGKLLLVHQDKWRKETEHCN